MSKLEESRDPGSGFETDVMRLLKYYAAAVGAFKVCLSDDDMPI